MQDLSGTCRLDSSRHAYTEHSTFFQKAILLSKIGEMYLNAKEANVDRKPIYLAVVVDSKIE